MNIIDTSQISDPTTEQPFTGPSLAFLQAATADAILGLAQGMVGISYSASTPYAIQGMLFTGSQSAPTSIFGGYILYNGELFKCAGHGGSFTIGNQFSVIVTQGTPDPLTFSDGSTKSVHNIRQLQILDTATAGLFTLANVVYIQAGNINNATIINSWTNFKTVQFFKDQTGKVNLDGIVTGGVGVPTSTIMFNLPIGYRPTTQKICSVICNDAGRTPQYEPCLLRINTNGDVEALPSQSATGTQSIYLAGVSFYLNW